MAEFLRNGKNTVPMGGANEFKRHSSRTTDGIEITASGTETTFATKRNNLNVTANIATIKSVTKVIITAVKHFLDIFKNGITDIDTAIGDSIEMIVKNSL